MIATDEPRKRRVFIASSTLDAAPVRKAMQNTSLHGVTLEEAAIPGTSWINSLYQCVKDADMVVGIMGSRENNFNVLFELGVASGLNKPVLLFVSPDYPSELIFPPDIPYLRMDLRNEDAVMFGLKQMLSLSVPSRITSAGRTGYTTRPIGALADQLLEKLPQTNPREFEDLIYDAIVASGVATIARGKKAEGMGVDFAIWSNDFEPNITNPLLIECKIGLVDQSTVDAATGQVLRALGTINNGCGIIVYKNPSAVPIASETLPIFFVSAKDFIEGLRDTGLAEYGRKLRDTAFHGF